jgi:sigma-B regulation protein RsbU (phosphoserine phosphatase)
MITAFLQTHQPLVAALAKNWLDSGVERFEIWAGENRLACWPASSHPAPGPALSAPVVVEGQEICRLTVRGGPDGSLKNRLQSEASLLAALITHENNTGAMAVELIATRDQLLALYNLTRRAGNSLEFGPTLEYLVQETVQLTQSRAAAIALQLNGSGLQIVQHPGPLMETASVLQHIETLKARRAAFWFVPGAQTGANEVGNNLLWMPIDVRGADTAVVCIRTGVEQVSLSPLIKLLRTIADYIGVRIENLIMVQESMELAKLNTEMRLARNIQASLNPKTVPVVQGLEVWAASQPASIVGGDFYDLIIKQDGPFTFTAGDISGKGIPAAIPMATARALVHYHTEAFPPPTPQMILCSLNEEFTKDFTELGMFATAFVGQYYPSTGIVLFANAGQSPVIYCPRNGKAHLLLPDSIPLGLFSGTEYGSRQLRLDPEDVLVIGTDGFYETHNDSNEPFGIDRLLQAVDARSGLSAQEIGEGLFAAVEHYRHLLQEDDQTLIVIKRTSDR